MYDSELHTGLIYLINDLLFEIWNQPLIIVLREWRDTESAYVIAIGFEVLLSVKWNGSAIDIGGCRGCAAIVLLIRPRSCGDKSEPD